MLPKLSSNSKGQALVEFALILVVLLLFIFIIIESGRLFQGNLTVQNAARAAGRYAMTGQFDTACLFESPPCLDARLTSIKREARRSAGGLAIDDLAIAGETNSFVTEVWSYDSEGQWRQDEVGGPGDPIDIIVRFQMPVVTPLLKPFADSVRLTGRIKVVAENYDQVGLTEGSAIPPETGGPGETGPPEADLAITKTASEDVVLAGAAVDYTITITNGGGFDAEAGITMVDTLPLGSTFTGYSFSPPDRIVTCSEDPQNTITCAMPWLDKNPADPKNKATVVLNTQAPLTAGVITNTATVYPGPTTVDPNPDNNSTIANVTVRDLWADLSVTIVDDPDPVRETAFLTYTLQVTNLDFEDATGVVLSATLPAETTFSIFGSAPGCVYDLATHVVTCTIGDLAVGGVYEAEIRVIADQDDDLTLPRTITIFASVAGNEYDPDPDNNLADETTAVADAWADLSIAKFGPGEPVVVDTPFTYILQVTNLGPNAVLTSTIVDQLPADVFFTGVFTPEVGVAGVSCTATAGNTITCDMGGLNSLDQDIGEPISKQVAIRVEALQPLHRFNTATVGGSLFDPYLTNNTDQVETFVGQADLIINKYGPLAIDAGQPMTYTVVVTNAGPLQATGVQIIDDLPANLTNVSALPAMTCQSTGTSQYTCNLPDLNPGEAFTVTVTGIAPDQDLIVNRASALYDFPDLNEADNTAVFTTTTTLIADLEVVKNADNDYNPGGGEALAGEQLRYFIQLGSLGPSPASGLIVTDTLPPSVEFASVSPKPECDYYPATHQVGCDMGALVLGPTINIQVNVTPTLAGLITNTVVVSGAQPDPDPNNNLDYVVVDVQPADLLLQKTATPSVLVGEAITYTLVVSNAGPSDAFDVVITDTLPVSVTAPISIQSTSGVCDGGPNPVVCTIPELALNESATITITVFAGSEGLAVNEAAATAQDATEVDLASASTAINPVTDLAINKVASGSFYAGEPLTYTLTITNYGPSVARSVHVTDTLPADAEYLAAVTPGGSCGPSGGGVNCTLDLIPIGGTQTITISTRALIHGEFVNLAEVGSATHDPDLLNNTTSITTTILPAADLGITKSQSGEFFAGEIFTYTLEVYNDGPSPAEGVIITDTLPPGVNFEGPPTLPCVHNAGTNEVVCTMANPLDAGSTFTVQIWASTNITGSHVNEAETQSAVPDLHQDDLPNTASLETIILAVANLSIEKGNSSGSPLPAVAGTQHTYAITVTNSGPNIATGVVVTDVLPVGMSYVSDTDSCTDLGSVISCTIGTLDVDTPSAFEITVDIAPSVNHSSTLTNVARVAANEADRDGNGNRAEAQTNVIRQVDMTIDKMDDGSAAVAGGFYTYTMKVTNNGPSDASSVVVTDTLPLGTWYARNSLNVNCPGTGSTVLCNLPDDIAVGNSYTFTLTIELDPSLATSPPGSDILENTAYVSAAEEELPGAPNSDTEFSDVVRWTDLAIQKFDEGRPAVVGEYYTYSMVVTNNGPSDASGVSIDDTLPDVTRFVTGTIPYCGGSGTDVICDIGDLSSGTSISVTVTVSITAAAVHGTTLTNLATVNGDEPVDPDPTNNTAEVDTLVLGKSELSIAKIDLVDPVIAGAELDYRITITNDGPSTASSIVVTDTLPAQTRYITSTVPCGNSGQFVTCTPADLASGLPTSFVITVYVSPTAGNGVTMTNWVEVSAAQVERDKTDNRASEVTLVEREADLSIDKADTGGPATAGKLYTYTITVTNSGPSDAFNVVVTDTLPADTILQASSGDICAGVSGDLTCSIGQLQATQSAVFTISVQVGSNVAVTTTLINTAIVDSNELDPVSGNNQDSTNTPVERSADVAVFKRGMGVKAIVGEPYTYTLDVSNNGPSDASGVIVTDTIPVSSTFVSATSVCPYDGSVVTCTVGNLPNGASDTFTVTVRVNDDVRHGAFIVNSAEVSADDSDPSPSNNTWSVSTQVTGKADLSIDKSDDGSDARAGDVYTYTVRVTNLGPSDARNVVITDTLPAHSSFERATGATCSNASISVCEFGMLTNGTTEYFSITVKFDADAPHNTVVTNTVQVISDEADLAMANNLDKEPTRIVRESDVFVTKADNNLPAVAGENYVYTVTVGTLGPSDATGVILTDTLPLYTSIASAPGVCAGPGATVTCTLGTLSAADSPTELVFTLLVSQAAPDGVAITNTVEISAVEQDSNLDNDQAEAGTVIERVADLAVQKSDLGNTPVAGQPFSYTITVTNNGPSFASSIEITDTLPVSVTLIGATPSCTGPDTDLVCPIVAPLAPSNSTTLTMTVFISETIGHGTTITNTAGVRAAESDPDPSNDTSTLTSLVLGNADLAIEKVGQGTPVAGLAYTYTITVTNNGPSEATGVTVVDTLPLSTTFAGPTDTCSGGGRTYTCTVAPLASGDSYELEISVDVDPAVAVDTTLTNIATVSGDQADLFPGNDSATADPLVERQVNLLINKSDDGSPAVAGQQYVFTVVVTNTGPSDAASVVVTDDLPPGTSYVSAGASCSEDSPGTITCDLGDMAAGGETSFDITVAVPSAAQDGVILTNTASVTSAEVASGPQDQETATVQRIADLAISKSDDGGPAIVGQNHTYTITVSNNGPSDASGIVITDTLPVSTTFVSSLPAGCSVNASNVRCSMLDLVNGASDQVQLTIGIDASVANRATISNTVNVNGAEFDDDMANNKANLLTDAIREVDLSVTKVDEGNNAVAGESYTYTIQVFNNDTGVSAAGIIVTDTLPLSTTFSSASDPSCAPDGRTVVCTLPELAVSANPTIDITVDVSPSVNQGATLTNTVKVAGDVVDPNTSNNDAQVTTVVDRSTDLRISKNGVPSDVVAGQSYGYTIVVGNDGPSDASGVVFTDTIPVSTTLQTPLPGGCSLSAEGMVCTLGALLAGSETTYNITIDVDSAVVTSTVLTNSVIVSGNEDDPLTGNNSDTDSANVVNQANLSLTKSASSATVYAGELVTFTLDVLNSGPSIATGLTVIDTYPGGLVISSTVVSGGTCIVAGTIDCDLDPLDIGASATITIVGSPVVTGTLTNSAIVSGDVIDPVPGNNDDSVDITSLPAADLYLPKPDTVNVLLGTDPTTEPITVTVVITNYGPLVASNSVLTFTFTSVGKNQWALNGSNDACIRTVNDEVSCNLDGIPAGATISLEISFLFGNQIVSTGIANYDVVVWSATHDPKPLNNGNSGVILFFP